MCPASVLVTAARRKDQNRFASLLQAGRIAPEFRAMANDAERSGRERHDVFTAPEEFEVPASAALAAALGASPAALKREWHQVGTDLTREEFAYLVSRHLGRHAELCRRPQKDLLTGTAELFAEATVLQADKTQISWRAFSQALIAATLAAGPPPRLASNARLVRARVVVDGSSAPQQTKKDGGPKLGRRKNDGGLLISAELSMHYLPKPMARFLVCEASESSSSYRLSLWQASSGGAGLAASRPGTFSCSNVLLEQGPLPSCVALVPTLRYATRETSVAAIATGITIVAGSSARSLTLFVLSAPPGASSDKRRFSVDQTLQLGTPAPLSVLAASKRASGTPTLWGGASNGHVYCWDLSAPLRSR